MWDVRDERERDVTVLMFPERLKSPPVTVSGESRDSPAPVCFIAQLSRNTDWLRNTQQPSQRI